MTSVIVTGAGIVGATAAFRLAEMGHEVSLVDRHDAGHATAAGAGIIAPGTSTRSLPAFYPFAADAVRYYPELVARLAELDAGDPKYEEVGYLFVATGDEEFEKLSEILQMMETRRAEGMPNLGEARQISADEAKSMFPALGDVAGAIHVPEAARVDGGSIRHRPVPPPERGSRRPHPPEPGTSIWPRPLRFAALLPDSAFPRPGVSPSSAGFRTAFQIPRHLLPQTGNPLPRTSGRPRPAPPASPPARDSSARRPPRTGKTPATTSCSFPAL